MIDVVKQEMKEKDAKAMDLTKLKATERTNKYFGLIFENKVSFLKSSDIKQHVVVNDVKEIELSLTNDVVLVKNKDGKYMVRNLDTDKEEQVEGVEKGCIVRRGLESENIEIPLIEDTVIAV